MKINNKKLSGGYKALICLLGLCGILIQAGVFEGNFDLQVFRYYTLLSNVLCCLYFGAASFFAFGGKDILFPKFKAMLIMGISVTGLVYHFMLSGSMFSMGSAMALANSILHYAVPIMSVLDWILFDEKGRYTWKSPLSWVILPDAYFVWATIYGYTIGHEFYGGSRFPYFFMDFDTLGLGGVLINVIVLNVIFAALGYIFYFADRLMSR